MKESLESLAEKGNSEGFLQETTELAQVMKNLDEDRIDPGTRMSSIDFNARLTGDQIKHSMIFDELVRLDIFPADSGLTRQMKRLSVSLAGQGRDEKVRIVQGERSQRTGGSFGERVMNLLRPQQ